MTSCGRRAFSYAGPDVWNSLPEHLRQTTSIELFRALSKNVLFGQISRSAHWRHSCSMGYISLLTYLLTYLQWLVLWHGPYSCGVGRNNQFMRYLLLIFSRSGVLRIYLPSLLWHCWGVLNAHSSVAFISFNMPRVCLWRLPLVQAASWVKEVPWIRRRSCSGDVQAKTIRWTPWNSLHLLDGFLVEVNTDSG